MTLCQVTHTSTVDQVQCHGTPLVTRLGRKRIGGGYRNFDTVRLNNSTKYEEQSFSFSLKFVLLPPVYMYSELFDTEYLILIVTYISNPRFTSH